MTKKEEKAFEPLQQVYAQMAYSLIAETILADHEDGEAFKLPPEERVIVSYGWVNGKAYRGVCIQGPGVVEGKDAIIFIRPDDWSDARTMLTVLTHEMIHAGLKYDDEDNKNHVGLYAEIAETVGLNNGGTEPNDYFLDLMDVVAEQLPPFPAAPLEGPETGGGRGGTERPRVEAPNSPNPPRGPQKNRSRRWVCDCGVIVRVARSDFDATCNLCNTIFRHKPAGSE